MTSHNPVTSISTKQKSPHHEPNTITKTIFKWSLTSKFRLISKYLFIYILIKSDHYQRERPAQPQEGQDRYKGKERRHSSWTTPKEIRKKGKEYEGGLLKHRHKREWGFGSSILLHFFPGHQERGCCPHRGGLGGRTKGRGHRAKAPALCSLPWFFPSIPWTKWCEGKHHFHWSLCMKKHGRMLSCWQV